MLTVNLSKCLDKFSVQTIKIIPDPIEAKMITLNDVESECCNCKDSSWLIKSIPKQILLDSALKVFKHSWLDTIKSYDTKTTKIINEDEFIADIVKIGAGNVALYLRILWEASSHCLTGEDKLDDVDYGLSDETLHSLQFKMFADWLEHYMNNQQFYHLSFDFNMYQWFILIMPRLISCFVYHMPSDDVQSGKLVGDLLLKITNMTNIVQRIATCSDKYMLEQQTTESHVIKMYKSKSDSENNKKRLVIGTQFLDFQATVNKLNAMLSQLCLLQFCNIEKANEFGNLCSYHGKDDDSKMIPLYWINQDIPNCRRLFDATQSGKRKPVDITFSGWMERELSTKDRLNKLRFTHSNSIHNRVVKNKEYRLQKEKLFKLLHNPKMHRLLINTCKFKQCLWWKCHKKDIKLVRCGQCKSAFYCSKQCQKKHWRCCHKNHCTPMKQRDITMQIRAIQRSRLGL